LSHLSDKQRNQVLGKLVEFWQQTFHLQRYDLSWEIVPDLQLSHDHDPRDDDASTGDYVHAATQCWSDRLMARTRFHRFIFEDPDYADVQQLSGLVAHELFHVVICDEIIPVQEELLNAAQGLPDEVKGAYAARFEASHERLVRMMESCFRLVQVSERKAA
jgi:hypothetical protein